MNIDRLFINDFEVDLFPDTVIAITYQINDFGSLEDRRASFSNKIKIPKTKRNLSIFQNSDRIQSPSDLPYKKMNVQVIRDGVDIVPFGLAVINSVSDKFELIIYAGNFDIFYSLENKKLRDLNLDHLDFLWDWFYFRSNRANTSGVKIPIFNHGELSNVNRLLDIQNQRPAIFINDVVQQIFIDAGYQPIGNLLIDERYLKTMITILNSEETESVYFNNRPDLVKYTDWFLTPPRPEERPPYRTSFFVPSGETWIFDYEITYHIPVWGTTLSIFEFTTDGSSTNIYSHTGSSGTYTANFSETKLGGLFVGSFLEPAIHFKDCDVDFYGGWVKGRKSGDPEHSFFFRITEHRQTYYTGSVTPPYNLGNVGLSLFTDYNGLVSVRKALPDWTQRDFLKMVFNLFGIICHSGWYDKKLYLKQFKEIPRSIPYAKDWSDKLHWIGQDGYESIVYKVGNYAQNNYFSYTEDTLDKKIFTDASGATGTIHINDENLPFERNAVTLMVSGSRMGKFLDFLDVPYTQRLDPATGRIKDQLNPRLLIDDTQDITGNPITSFDNYSNSEDITDDIPLCYFKLDGKDHNLSFDDVLNGPYEGLSDLLNKSKSMDVWMKLHSHDIFKFDHTIPIYLSQFAAYFYVSKIMNFTGKGLTKVELIRLETDYSAHGQLDVDFVDPPENYELQEDGGYSLGEDGWRQEREGGN